MTAAEYIVTVAVLAITGGLLVSLVERGVSALVGWNPIIICRCEGWWDFSLGRLTLARDSVRDALSRQRGLSEAPGFWYFDFGHGFRLTWRRRWIVWGADHPCRYEVLKHWDQFGTFAKTANPGVAGRQ